MDFTNDVDVSLVDSMGTDLHIVNAARASTRGWQTRHVIEDTAKDRGLINFLMREKHGTPFEHGAMTFMVRAPLFVWREHHRHRIGFSYNEESGRYKVLDPVFYMPAMARIQVGKPGAYTIENTPDPAMNVGMINGIQDSTRQSYEMYLTLLDMGVAREVARMVLPLNIMSTCFVTCNPRSLMNFMQLRLAENAQYEIRMIAEKYRTLFETLFPWTYGAWVANERVAP